MDIFRKSDELQFGDVGSMGVHEQSHPLPIRIEREFCGYYGVCHNMTASVQIQAPGSGNLIAFEQNQPFSVHLPHPLVEDIAKTRQRQISFDHPVNLHLFQIQLPQPS